MSERVTSPYQKAAPGAPGHERPAPPLIPKEGKMSHQPDKAKAQSNDKPFPIHPEGQYAARCVDVINLGLSVISYPGSTDYLAEKCVLVFYTGEKGVIQSDNGEWLPASQVDPTMADRVVHATQEYTLSMGKKAKLRAMATGWRGKPYSDDEAKKGIDVGAFFGHPALITVGHKTSEASGRTRMELLLVSKLPVQMKDSVPAIEDISYERDEWWTKRKEATRKETEEWSAKRNPRATPVRAAAGFEDFPEAMDGDDDLPF